ncbi:SAM-dependent methyltransferase [Nonomuraea endophytica]|uniref:O-methyltransferase involved in polyketide biosynthesis n=1 Tax=Nonomuraea endophytica TaxID=714136 RepID=A0A7W8EK64_9ACTN|nr:SAM-dependent methyltransferase [Nonomuraea endophytica]MBB5081402.1 O-methyltransferase involved in polyketide biosynthesis [Nonomuraea endophytica]
MDVTAGPARTYNELLGGKDGLGSRKVLATLGELLPQLPVAAKANAAFVHRGVEAVADAGVRQYLDLGCGLPAPNDRTILRSAREYQLEARVVYVDNDPSVAANARALLDVADGYTCCVEADARDVPKVISAAGELLDFREPTAIIMGALAHFWPADQDPYGIVRDYLAAFKSGYLIFSHACDELLSAEVRAQAVALYERMVAPIYPRNSAEILKFFDGLDLLEPGLVEASEWRTDYAVPPDVGDAQFLAAVAGFRGGWPGN